MVDTKIFFEDKLTALILIDLQRGVVVQETKPHTASDVVANSAKLVQAFRKAGLPVVFVHVLIGDREDILKPLLDKPAQLPPLTPDFTEFVPELGVTERDIVVTKRNPSAFYGTDLDLQLRRRNIVRIAIGGISTSVGVEATARNAYDRNYKLLFVEDAMTAQHVEEHDRAVKYVLPCMGIVRSTAEVLAALG